MQKKILALKNTSISIIDPKMIRVEFDLGPHIVCWSSPKISAFAILNMIHFCQYKKWEPACNESCELSPRILQYEALEKKSFDDITDICQTIQTSETSPDACDMDNYDLILAIQQLIRFQDTHYPKSVIHIYNCHKSCVNDQMMTPLPKCHYSKYFLFGNESMSAFIYVINDGFDLAFTAPHTHKATKAIVITSSIHECSINFNNS